MMDHPRYHQRTVQWGHWGITFMDVQVDKAKNFGEIMGTVYFAVINGCGPQDAGNIRQTYRDMCDNWVNNGTLPNNIQN